MLINYNHTQVCQMLLRQLHKLSKFCNSAGTTGKQQAEDIVQDGMRIPYSVQTSSNNETIRFVDIPMIVVSLKVHMPMCIKNCHINRTSVLLTLITHSIHVECIVGNYIIGNIPHGFCRSYRYWKAICLNSGHT